jgi:hypothetical protein
MPVRAWGEKIPDEVQNTHSIGCAYFISDDKMASYYRILGKSSKQNTVFS